jgi:cytochrome P450
MRFDWLLSSMPYGALWRRGRKLMHAHVNATVVDVYHPTQLSAARTFIATLLNTNPSPDALPAAVRSYFGAAIVKIVYGKDVKADDEFVRVPDEVLKRLNEAGLPGRFLVDLVPQRTLYAYGWWRLAQGDIFSEVPAGLDARRWISTVCTRYS